jgi:hypothetical protein
MKVFIENSFIEKLEADRESLLNNRLYNIIVNYPQIELFIDFEYIVNSYGDIQYETLELYKSKASFLPQRENDINHNWKDFNLILTIEAKNWFIEARQNGVLCFCFTDYESQISDIINEYHYRIDLSESDFDWTKLKFIKPLGKTYINDNYILVNSTSQKIEDNLLPLLYQIDSNNNSKCIEIYTIAQPKNQEKRYAIEKLEEKISLLTEKFTNWKFTVFNTDKYTDFDFHDRIIMTNVQLVECGKGFNLHPHKESNSNIISNTIFDLYTYKRLKNLERAHLKCSDKLNNNNNTFSVTKFPEN